MEDSNDRIVNQLIVKDVPERGKTAVPTSCRWDSRNWLPALYEYPCPHAHTRRMEAYYYFNLKPGNAICHLMGEPQEEERFDMAAQRTSHHFS